MRFSTRVLLLTLCLGTLSTTVSADLSNQTFVQTTANARWTPRWLSTSVVVAGQPNSQASMVVVGGALNQTYAATDVWASPDGAFWTLRTNDAGFPQRLGGCVFSEGGTIALAGGVQYLNNDLQSPSWFNDVWVSTDSSFVSWTQRTANASWSPREGAACISFLGDWFLLGGITGTSSASNEIWQSTDNGLTWTASDTQPSWAPRGYFGVTTFVGRLYIAGGVNHNATVFFNDVYSSSDGFTWVRMVASAPWNGRSHSCFFALNGVLWLVGGQRSGSLQSSSQIWRSDGSGHFWESVDGFAVYGPRDFFGCAVMTPAATAEEKQEQQRRRLLATDGAVSSSSSGTDTRIFVLGGRQLKSGTRFGPLNDVWSSTRNLLCEEDSLVCSGRGVCLTSSWSKQQPKATSTFADAPMATALAVPPLPLNCTCEPGFVGSRCEENFCTAATCLHGTCVPVNTSSSASSYRAGPSGSTGGSICVCSDPNKWTGVNCDQAICAAGCSSLHGSCTNNPGTCTCDENFIGADCSIELTWIRKIGRYVDSHVSQIYVSVTVAGIVVTSTIALLTNIVAAHSLTTAMAAASSGASSASALAAGKASLSSSVDEDSATGGYSFVVPLKDKLFSRRSRTGSEAKPLLTSSPRAGGGGKGGGGSRGSLASASIEKGYATSSGGRPSMSAPVDIASPRTPSASAGRYQQQQTEAGFSLPQMGGIPVGGARPLSIAASASSFASPSSSSFQQAALAIAASDTAFLAQPPQQPGQPTVIIGSFGASTAAGGGGALAPGGTPLPGVGVGIGSFRQPASMPKRVRFSQAEDDK